MEQAHLEAMVEALVAEVSRLHAELVTAQTMALAGNPESAGDLGGMAVRSDDFTLFSAMSEEQRATVKARLEQSLSILKAHRRVAYPGGWRGVRAWFRGRVRAIWMTCFGPALQERMEAEAQARHKGEALSWPS